MFLGENRDNEIDSSITVEEEIADLMAGGAVGRAGDAVDQAGGAADQAGGAVEDLLEEDEVCVGTNLEQYIGYEFSSQTATNAWMKWDTRGSH